MTIASLPSRELHPQEVPPIPYSAAPGRRHFWLRRFHSLLGLFFGGYITVHLLTNATGIWPRVYQQNVDKIHQLEPLLPLVEILFIFLPLIIHAVYGTYIAKAGIKFNTTHYNYGGNVRYFLQRVTAIFLLLFVIYHIATLHKWGLGALHVNGFPQFNPKNTAYQTTVSAIQHPTNSAALNAIVIVFYLLGVWSAVFHWANGLWTAAIAWGLTLTAAAQRRWGHFCLGFGIFMLIVGTAAWAAFAFGNPNLPLAQTRTLPEEVSEQVHALATGGQNTNSHIPAGVNPSASQP